MPKTESTIFIKVLYDGRIYLHLDELLIKDTLVSIHETNNKFLANETLKIKNRLSTISR